MIYSVSEVNITWAMRYLNTNWKVYFLHLSSYCHRLILLPNQKEYQFKFEMTHNYINKIKQNCSFFPSKKPSEQIHCNL